MENALVMASAITDQRKKIEQYKHILSSVISSNNIVHAKKFIYHTFANFCSRVGEIAGGNAKGDCQLYPRSDSASCCLLRRTGEDKYYIFSRGSYKVGRKGCDVIINKDKGVSRIHTEIFVDEMISLNHLQRNSSKINSEVRIRDCSKYGTFINKNSDQSKNFMNFRIKKQLLRMVT